MKNKIILFFYVLFFITFFSSCAISTLINEIDKFKSSDNKKNLVVEDLKLSIPIGRKTLTIGDFWSDKTPGFDGTYDGIKDFPYFPARTEEDASNDYYYYDNSDGVWKMKYSWPNNANVTLNLVGKTLNLGVKKSSLDLNGDGSGDVYLKYIRSEKSSIKAYIKLKDISNDTYPGITPSAILKINPNQFGKIGVSIKINDVTSDIIFSKKYSDPSDDRCIIAEVDNFLKDSWGNLFPINVSSIDINSVSLEVYNNRTDSLAVHERDFEIGRDEIPSLIGNINNKIATDDLMKFDVKLEFSFGSGDDIGVIGSVADDHSIDLFHKNINFKDLGIKIKRGTLMVDLTTDFPFGLEVQINSGERISLRSIEYATPSYKAWGTAFSPPEYPEGYYEYNKPKVGNIDRKLKFDVLLDKDTIDVTVDIVHLIDSSGDNIGDLLFDINAIYDFKIDLSFVADFEKEIQF